MRKTAGYLNTANGPQKALYTRADTRAHTHTQLENKLASQICVSANYSNKKYFLTFFKTKSRPVPSVPRYAVLLPSKNIDSPSCFPYPIYTIFRIVVSFISASTFSFGVFRLWHDAQSFQCSLSHKKCLVPTSA